MARPSAATSSWHGLVGAPAAHEPYNSSPGSRARTMPVRRLYWFGIVGAAFVWSNGAAAQDSASAQSAARRAAAESAVELPTAPVTVDGVALFRVRGISSY